MRRFSVDGMIVCGFASIVVNCSDVCMPVAKGRTNLELREQFHLAEGVSQTMSAFKSRTVGRQTSPAAAGGSQPDSTTTGSSATSGHAKV